MATVTLTNITKDLAGITHETGLSATASADPPPVPVVIWSMAAIAVATVAMWLSYRYVIKPVPIKAAAGYVPYAGVLAVAAGLERLLEPLSDLLAPNTGNKKAAAASLGAAKQAAADPAKPASDVQALADTAAQDQASTDRQRTARAIIFWAIASVCGIGISGGFGFFLLQSVSSNHVNSFLDLAVTGLTIGAGTKPVHDFVTSLQSKAAK